MMAGRKNRRKIKGFQQKSVPQKRSWDGSGTGEKCGRTKKPAARSPPGHRPDANQSYCV